MQFPTDPPGLDEPRCSYSSPGLMSVDSAIHSWDSSNPGDAQNENNYGTKTIFSYCLL